MELDDESITLGPEIELVGRLHPNWNTVLTTRLVNSIINARVPEENHLRDNEE
jgi:hypothetical protein